MFYYQTETETLFTVKTEKKSFDDLVIRVNPIKFPAKYLEPKRNFIPSGRGALPRTPTKTPQSPTDEELDKKSEELRRIEDSLLRSRNELPRTPILPPQKPDNSKKIELPLKKEVGIQTGGILTVKQKSTQNYIPSGRHQLRRSAKEPRLRGCDVDIEVIHDDLKVSKMNWRGTSQISLRIQPQTPKIPESSNEPVFDTMFGKKTLKPIKSTTSGVLMVLMDK